MRIAINLRQFYKGKIGGMENYVRNIVGGLRHHDLTIWVHRDEVAHVREFAPTASIHGITHETGLSEIGAALKPENFDLFFCPLLVLEPLVVDVPSAVMMPDIQHEFFPECFDASVLKWRKDTYGPTARNTDILFTLSEHAKQTIVDTYGAPAAKVLPIHLDADDEFRAPASCSDSPRLPARYLYFPANFWPHKNHENIFEALRIAVDGGEEIDLVLTGAEAGSEKALEQAARLGLASRVHYLGHVAKHLVPEIYRRAEALLFATKFEGFGIPILEAFYCGTPVITSSAGSCVEVAGEAAVLVDPQSPESIAGGIVKLLRDGELRRALVEKGAERVKLFSWASAIERTEKAFREAVARPKPTRVEVTEWPIIGIVTPTYNMAHFLEETIQSVLSQGYDKLDYVVMDGGSRDGTVEILRKYEGPAALGVGAGWRPGHGDQQGVARDPWRDLRLPERRRYVFAGGTDRGGEALSRESESGIDLRRGLSRRCRREDSRPISDASVQQRRAGRAVHHLPTGSISGPRSICRSGDDQQLDALRARLRLVVSRGQEVSGEEGR
ncbi:MAG: glycosyltransferase [Acidobacteria bacterium]|nr:glycosyltransferase [Acidobacteriota bacterium]